MTSKAFSARLMSSSCLTTPAVRHAVPGIRETSRKSVDLRAVGLLVIPHPTIEEAAEALLDAFVQTDLVLSLSRLIRLAWWQENARVRYTEQGQSRRKC